jgi:aminotransferase
MSQVAIVKAALEGDDRVAEMRAEYDHRRKVVMQGFKDAGLECFTPYGAFYAFPSIKEFGLTSEQFCERFLMEKKVAIVPGNAFGKCGEGHFRLSYAASMENIKTAMERLKEFTDALRKEKRNA